MKKRTISVTDAARNSGRALAEALAKNELPEEEAVAWHRDLKSARKTLKARGNRGK